MIAVALAGRSADADEPYVPVAVELAAPPEWDTYPNAMNNRGEISGFRVEEETEARAIVWRNPEAEAEILPVFEGETLSWAGFLNERGQIAGRIGDRAVVWNRDGSIIDLAARLTDVTYSEAWSINGRSAAVGWARPLGQTAARAVLWPRRGDGIVLPLDETVYYSSYGSFVNDKGVVSGYVTLLPSGRPYHAVYWTRRRTFVDLHPFVAAAMPTAVASVAHYVLKDGRIAGVAWEPISTDVTVQRPWVFDPRHGTLDFIDAGGYDVATVWAGNGSRYLVGYLGADWIFDVYATEFQHPALWTRSGPHRRPRWSLTTFDVPPGLDGFSLWSVNRKGALVGVGAAESGKKRAHYIAPPPRRRAAR